MIPRHVRGTILLVDGCQSSPADVERWRGNGLIVHHSTDLPHALTQFPHAAPDVIVVVAPARESEPIVAGVRSRADHATSIIAVSDPGERDAVRQAGADAFLSIASASSVDLLYEIHRALILRRSGRRLTWS